MIPFEDKLCIVFKGLWDVTKVCLVFIFVSFYDAALKGGPLQDKFRLCQFHFHWGESNAWGSEHTVDRSLFPAEVLSAIHTLTWANKETAMIRASGCHIVFDVNIKSAPTIHYIRRVGALGGGHLP